MTALAIVGFADGLLTRAIHPAGTWIDGWNLNTARQYVRAVGHLSSDARSDFLIQSDWGIGVFHYDGTVFRASFGAPRNTMFGSYRYDATDRAGRDRVMAIANFTGADPGEILVWNSGGMVTLSRTTSGLQSTRFYPNGTRLGGWILSTVDNRYWGNGRFDADARQAMVITSPWGLGLISPQRETSIFMAPHGTRLGSWELHTGDRVMLIADLDGDGQDEIVMSGVHGIGVLKLVDGRLVSIAVHANGVSIDGFTVGGPDKMFVVDRVRVRSAEDMVVLDMRGMHLLSLGSGRLQRRAFVPSGTRIDGWLLDPQNNTLFTAGDLTGDGPADFVARSPWGIGVMSVGSDDRFRCRSLHPYGTPLGGWPLESSDIIAGSSAFMGSGRNELLLVKPWVGSALTPSFAPREFVNWHRNIRRSLPTVRPANLAELVSAVRTLHARGDIAGIAGSGWSYTDCVVGDRTDALIDTSALDAMIGNLVPDIIDDRLEGGHRLVHIEAGIKLYDLNCKLDALSLALPTMGGSRGQSLAGVLSTGVHGGDVELPPIADAVRAIHLVGSGGQQWWIEPATRSISSNGTLDQALAKGILDPSIKRVYDDDWFNAVLVAMGCAGVIYSVVVECRPAFRLRQTIASSSWSSAKIRISDLSVPERRPRYLEINVNPADSSCLVTTREETAEAVSPPTPGGGGGPSIGQIAAGIGLIGPGALGLLFGAIGDYVARTTAEIAGLAAIPFAGPFLATEKTVQALQPVQDMHRLLVELGLAAVNPNDPGRVADVLPTAINVLWAIGAFIVPGRVLVDQLQAGITRQQRPLGMTVGRSYQVMTGQPNCPQDGLQTHDETQRLIESYEYAVPASRAVEFVDRLIAVTAEQRGGPGAVIVNLNLRFTGRSRATLAMQKFGHTCHVEVYTFRGLRGNDGFKRRLHEVVTAVEAVPHPGQLHVPAEARTLGGGGALARWQGPIRAISGGSQMFWSSFALARGLLP